MVKRIDGLNFSRLYVIEYATFLEKCGGIPCNEEK